MKTPKEKEREIRAQRDQGFVSVRKNELITLFLFWLDKVGGAFELSLFLYIYIILIWETKANYTPINILNLKMNSLFLSP